MPPSIKPHFNVIGHDPNTVEIRSGVWNPTSHLLRDETLSGHLFNIIRSLDGSNAPEAIARQEKISRAEVEAVLDQLRALDVVAFEPPTGLDYYLQLGVPFRGEPFDGARVSKVVLVGPRDLTERIDNLLRPVLLGVSFESLTPDQSRWSELIEQELSNPMDPVGAERFMISFDDWKGSLIICALSSVHPMLQRNLNRICVSHQLPCLHGSIDGPFLFVGPMFIPGGACFECFETRVLMNVKNLEQYSRYKNALLDGRAKINPFPMDAPLASLLASHIALEAINYYLSGASFVRGKVLSIFLPIMEFSYCDVLKVPSCEACGSIAGRDECSTYFDARNVITGSV